MRIAFEPLKQDGYVNSTVPPWIEITTILPCSVRCSYCPQDVLAHAYKGHPRLTMHGFKQALEHVPQFVIIAFAGFAEPFLNGECANMMIYAHDSGYRIAVASTLIGLTDEDAERIQHIPFTCFWYHDTGRQMKRYPFLTELVRIESPTSRAGNLFHEDRREGIGTCRRSRDHTANVMLPNGDVVLCCNDYGLKHVLGNLFATRYEDLNREEGYELCHFCPDLEIEEEGK